jgi:hypothetical protein
MVTYNTKSSWIRQILNCKARTYKEWCLKITSWTPLEENSKKQKFNLLKPNGTYMYQLL